MSWASRRRLTILIIIGAVVAAFITVVGVVTFYKSPSCSDGVQNEGEAGIDCGGPCLRLCTTEVQPPTVLFTKMISNGAGRTDVVASVENINAGAAAKNVPYTITLYGANQVFVQQVTGTLDLPPSATVPVFIPGVYSGNQTAVQAFLTIASSSPKWYKVVGDPRLLPVVTNTTLSGTTDAPRIDAVLSNSSVTTMTDVHVIAIVHDDQGEIVAASQTIVPSIPAQGQATATFTWNSALSGVSAQIEAIPVIPLP